MRRNPTEGDIHFNPRLEISPFALFRAFKDGRSPELVDVRLVRGPSSFLGAILFADPDWIVREETEVVLFDDDGEYAIAMTHVLQAAGFPRVRALFGGLTLYDFALDPAVVGEERFLSGPLESDPSS